jgi:hypothetical protein
MNGTMKRKSRYLTFSAASQSAGPRLARHPNPNRVDAIEELEK